MPRAFLSRPAGSKAVLIGVGAYRSAALEDLSAVPNGLADLRALLTDPGLWGIAADAVTELALAPDLDDDATREQSVLEHLELAAASATDTLLLYYAGHGETCGSESDLYLTLPGSDPAIEYTMIDYRHIRGILLRSSARYKIVILDCCFSARGIDGAMGPVTLQQLAGPEDMAGQIVLTASGENRLAMAPAGERYTAFTGELIALLKNGVPDGPRLLTIDFIYHELCRRLRDRNLPEPQCSSRNLSTRLALVHNRGFRPGGQPSPDPDFEQDIVPVRSSQDTARILAGLESRHAEVVRTVEKRCTRYADCWIALRDLLIAVVHVFDPTPFPGRPDPRNEGEIDVPLMEIALPRLAALTERLVDPEWEALAATIYDFAVADRIKMDILADSAVARPGNPNLAWPADDAATEQLRHVQIRGFSDQAVKLARRSAGFIDADVVDSEPLLERAAEPIELLDYNESDDGQIIGGCAVPAALFATLEFTVMATQPAASLWQLPVPLIGLTIGLKMYANMVKQARGLPSRTREYFAKNRPW